jgi:hypothetical protein
MTDERNGKPSASGMSRLSDCAGSWNLEKTLPEQEPNPYMQLGTDVHAVLAGTKEYEELTEEGQEIATLCLSGFTHLIAQLDLGQRTQEILEQTSLGTLPLSPTTRQGEQHKGRLAKTSN